MALQSDPPPLIEGRRRGRRGAEKNAGKRRTQPRKEKPQEEDAVKHQKGNVAIKPAPNNTSEEAPP